MSETYTATAVPWAQGWELHVDGVGVTQVRVLAKAAQQVRDLIETMTGVDAGAAQIQFNLNLNGIEKEILDIKQRMQNALWLQAQAAEDMRRVVADLRRDGISVSDIATVLDVSRGRVSQLLAD